MEYNVWRPKLQIACSCSIVSMYVTITEIDSCIDFEPNHSDVTPILQIGFLTDYRFLWFFFLIKFHAFDRGAE